MTLYDNIPRIYTAIAEWLSCMIVCLSLKRKINNQRFAIYAVAFFLIQSVLLVFTDSLPNSVWLLIMGIAFFNMGFFLYLCCDLNRRVIVYYAMFCIMAAEFVASFEWQLASFLPIIRRSVLTQTILFFVAYGLFFFIFYRMEQSSKKSLPFFDINKNELLAVICIAAVMFLFSNISFVVKYTPFSGSSEWDNFYIRTLVDLAGMIMLFAYKGRICEMNAQREINSINSVLKEQYDKYRSYQSGFDMINIKYHDLKHQIAGLRADMSDEKREEWISKMEEELESYRPELQTGNSVLDTIIAGKMMECRRNHIKLTCVADGTLLNFIHVADLCNIFGNALDNAIEAVSLVREEEKRLIHMSVSAQKRLVLIQISNYCEEAPKIVNDLPQTTKEDKVNHGFGTKSINHTVSKYNGYVEYKMKEQWFELKILIPQTATYVK
ncbi:MAG: ATP-binding protein [Lachnospiraceae bacterium]|nr:ATP-binding protein [Lachnospiraceae bacterium]